MWCFFWQCLKRWNDFNRGTSWRCSAGRGVTYILFASFVFLQNSYCCTLHTTGQHKLAPSRAFPALHFRKYLQRISPPFQFHHQHQISLAKHSAGRNCSCVVYDILYIMTHRIQFSHISPETIAFFLILGLFLDHSGCHDLASIFLLTLHCWTHHRTTTPPYVHYLLHNRSTSYTLSIVRYILQYIEYHICNENCGWGK